MISVSYISRSMIGGDIGVLIDIWEVSQRKNRDRGITGGLYCDTAVFLQTLEGPSPAIMATLRRVMSDERHRDIQLMFGGKIAKRRFNDWDMKVVNAMSDPDMSVRFQRERLLNGGHRYFEARLSEMLAA